MTRILGELRKETSEGCNCTDEQKPEEDNKASYARHKIQGRRNRSAKAKVIKPERCLGLFKEQEEGLYLSTWDQQAREGLGT